MWISPPDRSLPITGDAVRLNCANYSVPRMHPVGISRLRRTGNVIKRSRLRSDAYHIVGIGFCYYHRKSRTVAPSFIIATWGALKSGAASSGFHTSRRNVRAKYRIPKSSQSSTSLRSIGHDRPIRSGSLGHLPSFRPHPPPRGEEAPLTFNDPPIPISAENMDGEAATTRSYPIPASKKAIMRLRIRNFRTTPSSRVGVSGIST